jgi:prepilin-type N-terminal cleavage/methylation domain-containing protein
MLKQPRAGFTLIELMISLTMLAIVLGGLTTSMVTMQRGYTRQRETARSEDALRNAEVILSTIFRYAGANPRNINAGNIPRIDPFAPPFDSVRVVADFNPSD